MQDVLDVYTAGGEDLDVLETIAVELPAGLLYEVPKVAAAVAGGVESDGEDRLRDGPGGQECSELLVVKGVYEDGTWTSGEIISLKARAASAVEPRMRTSAGGMVPVAGMPKRSAASSTATPSQPPR